jgi:hypothetical protein
MNRRNAHLVFALSMFSSCTFLRHNFNDQVTLQAWTSLSMPNELATFKTVYLDTSGEAKLART